jgi:hypothetical protein
LPVLWFAASRETPVVEAAGRPTAHGASGAAVKGDAVTFAARAEAKVGNDLFASHSWYVAPPPPPPPAAPVVPTAPPLPYTFLGSYVKSGTSRFISSFVATAFTTSVPATRLKTLMPSAMRRAANCN